MITSIRTYILLLVISVLMGSASAAEETFLNPALKPFYEELRRLVVSHYPKASAHLLKDQIHFESDTRAFLIHERTKTGERQDPREERGPKLSGIHGGLTLQQGRYQGAAAVPQTFDKRYFSVLILAPYSPKLDAHLHVRLAYPKNVNAEFLKQFTALVTSFEKNGE